MNRLRDLREDRNLNQTQIAEFLNMSQTGYSKYETGENDIPTDVLIKLSKFYHVSIYMQVCSSLRIASYGKAIYMERNRQIVKIKRKCTLYCTHLRNNRTF